MSRCEPCSPRPSTLALAVLGLLEVGPLHPYGLQRLIKLWGKDQVVNVGQRANLYRTINRLQAAGLVAVHATPSASSSSPSGPCTSSPTLAVRRLAKWLTDMLATPRYEFPEFPAALSFVMVLGPDETLLGARTTRRRGARAARRARSRSSTQYRDELPRRVAARNRVPARGHRR